MSSPFFGERLTDQFSAERLLCWCMTRRICWISVSGTPNACNACRLPQSGQIGVLESVRERAGGSVEAFRHSGQIRRVGAGCLAFMKTPPFTPFFQTERRHRHPGFGSETFLPWQTPHQPAPAESTKFASQISGFRFAGVLG